jgi:hypothetical protein
MFRTKTPTKQNNMTRTELKDYETEMLQKIQQNDIFEYVPGEEDYLGNFIDRVIDRSLYLYKNR